VHRQAAWCQREMPETQLSHGKLGSFGAGLLLALHALAQLCSLLKSRQLGYSNPVSL